MVFKDGMVVVNRGSQFTVASTHVTAFGLTVSAEVMEHAMKGKLVPICRFGRFHV